MSSLLSHPMTPPSLHSFLSLSYPVSPATQLTYLPPNTLVASLINLFTDRTTLYDKGIHDIPFVLTCAVGFTVLREACIRFVFSPFVRSWLVSSAKRQHESMNGHAQTRLALKREERMMRKREKTVTRFAEQSWSFFYCSTFWTVGLIILLRTPRPTSSETLWASYPVQLIPALTKFYYLGELGYWFHQIYVINTEKRRSDHWQMFAHHILSITLITTSYLANCTRVGVLIHCLMDFCDILLPLAKMFRYLSLFTLCDATFVVFLVGWLISRQIGLLLVILSTINSPNYVPLIWDPPTGRYLTQNTLMAFIVMLTILWCMASVWFYMACRVAVRVVRGLGAEDSRSDDEEESPLEDVPDLNGSAGTTEPMKVENGYANGELRKRTMT